MCKTQPNRKIWCHMLQCLRRNNAPWSRTSWKTAEIETISHYNDSVVNIYCSKKDKKYLKKSSFWHLFFFLNQIMIKQKIKNHVWYICLVPSYKTKMPVFFLGVILYLEWDWVMIDKEIIIKNKNFKEETYDYWK